MRHDRTGRIDTTITLVEVRPGNATTNRTHQRVAVDYVTDAFPDTNVLGAWHTGTRGDHGWFVWAVEHDTGDNQS